MNRRAFISAVAALPWFVGGCARRVRSGLRWEQFAPLPERLGVAGPFAGVSSGALLAAGGANFPNGFPWQGGKKMWHDRVWALDNLKGAWREAGRLPRPLAYGVSVSTARGVVCVGGSDSERYHADVFRLVWNGRSLHTEPMPSLPLPLANAAAALAGRRLIVCGGASEPGEQSALNRCWSLDLPNESAGWRELEPLPGAARFLCIASANGDDFYLFGGVSLTLRDGKMSRVFLRDAWRHRAGVGWQRLADLPRPLAAAPSPAPVAGSEILLLPGDDGSRFGFQPAEKHPGFPRRLLAYDIRRDTWRDAGEAPFAHVTTPCVEWRGRFVVPSGEVRPGVRSPEVWSLIRA